MGREPRYWVNPTRMREHWNEVMLRPGKPPPVYVSSDNVLHIDTTRVKIPDAWYIRGLPGGVPFNKPPKPGPTPPPLPGRAAKTTGEPRSASRAGSPQTPARFQRETSGNQTPSTKALAAARSREDIRTPETACVVPSRLQSLQANAENIFSHLGGQRTDFAIVICDQATILKTASTEAKIGVLTREAGGALTDFPNKIIWVSEEALTHGVQRSWGATLNPRQVIAHEIGHATTGSADCAVASQSGAKLSGLSEAERQSLLIDALKIKQKGGI